MKNQEKNTQSDRQVYCMDCIHVHGFLDFLNEEIDGLPEICSSCYSLDIEDSAPISLKTKFEAK